MQELMAYLSLFFILLGIGIFVWGFCTNLNEKANVNTRGHDGQYRIVQLANGTYMVQQYKYYAAEWSYPEAPGQYQFDTFDGAKKRMDELVAEEKRLAGNRVVREVARS